MIEVRKYNDNDPHLPVSIDQYLDNLKRDKYSDNLWYSQQFYKDTVKISDFIFYQIDITSTPDDIKFILDKIAKEHLYGKFYYYMSGTDLLANKNSVVATIHNIQEGANESGEGIFVGFSFDSKYLFFLGPPREILADPEEYSLQNREIFATSIVRHIIPPFIKYWRNQKGSTPLQTIVTYISKL